MAGNANSGGNRPTAPQNNTGVSATGGAGSADGVPNINYTGFAYSQNKAVNDQMNSGLQLGQTSTVSTESTAANTPKVTPITEPSPTAERDIYYGMPFGPGPGREAIALPQGISTQDDPSEQVIRALYQQNPNNEDLRYIVETIDAKKQVLGG